MCNPVTDSRFALHSALCSYPPPLLVAILGRAFCPCPCSSSHSAACRIGSTMRPRPACTHPTSIAHELPRPSMPLAPRWTWHPKALMEASCGPLSGSRAGRSRGGPRRPNCTPTRPAMRRWYTQSAAKSSTTGTPGLWTRRTASVASISSFRAKRAGASAIRSPWFTFCTTCACAHAARATSSYVRRRSNSPPRCMNAN